MSFKLETKGLKKVASDKESTTLRHPDGHEMKIYHKPLSPKARSHLASVPMAMAEGGDVAPQSETNKAPPVIVNVNGSGGASGGWSPQQPDQAQAMGNAYAQALAPQPQTPVAIPSDPMGAAYAQAANKDIPGPAPQMSSPAPSAPEAAPPATPVQAPTQQAPDPFGSGATMNAFEQGQAQAQSGILGGANALGNLGKTEAKLHQQQAENEQQNLSNYKQNWNDLNAERNHFLDDYKNQHIDPNHYLNSMGTGDKIATTIGLILGGFSGGALHTSNPALDFLNKQIDRDIEGQKMEIGKKENLLSANMKQFGNIRDATDMTRVMQTDIAIDKLKQAAAQAQDPIAKYRAMQAIGEMNMTNADRIGQMTMRKTLLSGVQNGTVPPDKVVNLLIPENQRAAANKELQEATELSAARDNALSAFDQVAALNTAGNRLTSPIQTSKRVDAITQPVIAALSKATAGRFTDQDAGMLKAFYNTKYADKETQDVQRRQLDKIISEKMHPESFPILKTYGIDISKLGRYGSQGAPRIQESAPVINGK